MIGLEATRSLAEIGTPSKSVDRNTQMEIADCMGVSRVTVTRLLGKWSAPQRCPKCRKAKIVIVKLDELLRCVDCGHEFVPTWNRAARAQASKKMKDICAVHPHWKSQSAEGGDADKTRCETTSRPQATRRHVACILVRNPCFNSPNTYTLALPDSARPGLKGDSDPCAHAKILASHFGADIYDPTAEVNGYRDSWGFNWNKHLPDAPDCECVQQKSFEFQQACPKCQGVGYTIGGSMPDTGRILLHWLNDRGIDQEIRRCNKCNRSYSQNQAKHWPKCPGCSNEGFVTKARGILGGPNTVGYTEAEIAEANGCHASTVRRYFKTFKRLKLIRTVYGQVWYKCCGQVFTDRPCPKCGNKCPAISHREPWKILWLPCRTLDKELAKAEQQRLEALVRWHRRFLDAGQQKRLEDAVKLALQLLGEWTGKEHQLTSFYHEMRRRLYTFEHKRFINVLFPGGP